MCNTYRPDVILFHARRKNASFLRLIVAKIKTIKCGASLPMIILSVFIGICSALICSAVGQITMIEALAIYSITGTAAALMLVFPPKAAQPA